MKKILSMILALTMIFSLSITAFAADEENTTLDSEYRKDITVGASYTAGTTEVKNVYSVSLSWTVTGGSKNDGTVTYTWSPSEEKYVPGTAEGASTTDPKVEINITNKSDMNVYATATYVDAGTGAGTSATEQSVTIPTGVTVTEKNYAEATYSNKNTTKTITMNISVGDWTKLDSTAKTIGTVTVSLSKTNPNV